MHVKQYFNLQPVAVVKGTPVAVVKGTPVAAVKETLLEKSRKVQKTLVAGFEETPVAVQKTFVKSFQETPVAVVKGTLVAEVTHTF